MTAIGPSGLQKLKFEKTQHQQVERVMRAALERGCYLEVNAQPDRLDLNEVHGQMAKELGLKVAISTDADSVANLDLMRFGVDRAASPPLRRPATGPPSRSSNARPPSPSHPQIGRLDLGLGSASRARARGGFGLVKAVATALGRSPSQRGLYATTFISIRKSNMKSVRKTDRTGRLVSKYPA